MIFYLEEGVFKIILAVLLTILFTQISKIFYNYFKTKKFEWEFIYGLGGFPSSHAGTVVSLTLAIFLLEGFSLLFFVSFIFSLIVIRDALGIRRYVGKHAEILNKKMKLKLPVKIGHSISEVIGGILYGIIITLAVFIFLN